jgi:hypothetical protein
MICVCLARPDFDRRWNYGAPPERRAEGRNRENRSTDRSKEIFVVAAA